jgi:hypothetical protein
MREWNKPHGNKNERENYLRALEFRCPKWIPCSVGIFPSMWQKYRKQMTALVSRHPFIFGTFAKHKHNYDSIPLHHRPNTYFVDKWGCKWYSSKGGFEGQVIESPLADYTALNAYTPPDPLKYSERGTRSWRLMNLGLWFMRKKGILTAGSGERLFDRMYFLRGFDNLMRDFATNNPNLPKLIAMLQDHELKLINKWLTYKIDIMNFHTDIGTQDRLMISPAKFRKYIKPFFTEIFQTCRKAGVHVYLSSDGYLLEIVDDLIESGVSVHDPQLRANGLDGIAKFYKGKMCVDLDLDRQSFPFLSPEEIRLQVKESINALSSPKGGLMLKAEFSDTNVPLENIEAMCKAMEEFCFLT